jgi:hypothetical protein
MNYTATKIRRDYLRRLQHLADLEHRSMMKELEYLIDTRLSQIPKAVPASQPDPRKRA